MVSTRGAFDAVQKLFFGRSQEYLDELHRVAEKYRTIFEARGPPPIWYPPSDSGTEFEDADGAPMSPPSSPRQPRDENVLDLSEKAWERRVWIDISQGIEPRDTGFIQYETWRSHMISEHAMNIMPSPASSVTANVMMEDEIMEDMIMEDATMKTSSQPVLTASKRQVFIKSHSHSSSLTRSIRLTRSQATMESIFYELGLDGKTSQTLVIPSLKKPTKPVSPLQTIRSTRTRKGRNPCRIQKK